MAASLTKCDRRSAKQRHDWHAVAALLRAKLESQTAACARSTAPAEMKSALPIAIVLRAFCWS
eukprot:3866043-Amphidinium_carterae.1